MKKTNLILLVVLTALSFNYNAAENPSNLRKVACIAAGTISLGAFIPALLSDLKAPEGTAQAEVPLCILPACTLLVATLLYGK